MAIEFFYWGMVALFFTHELDAVRRHEWRILPIINRFSESSAELLFIYLHVPLFLLIFWMSKGGPSTVYALCFSMFSVVHVVLHWAFRRHPKNEFVGFSSWAIIVLTAAFGVLHMLAYAIY